MKLPKEPLMGDRPYQAHARKLVGQQRSSIESTLNRTEQQNIFYFLSVAATVIVFITTFVLMTFSAALVVGGLTLFIAILAYFNVPSHPPEYGEWKVICYRKRFERGETVSFTCERFVNGEVVETKTSN